MTRRGGKELPKGLVNHSMGPVQAGRACGVACLVAKDRKRADIVVIYEDAADCQTEGIQASGT